MPRPSSLNFYIVRRISCIEFPSWDLASYVFLFKIQEIRIQIIVTYTRYLPGVMLSPIKHRFSLTQIEFLLHVARPISNGVKISRFQDFKISRLGFSPISNGVKALHELLWVITARTWRGVMRLIRVSADVIQF